MIKRLCVFLMTILILLSCKYKSQPGAVATNQVAVTNTFPPAIIETSTNQERTPIEVTSIPSPITTIPVATTPLAGPTITATPYLLPIHDLGVQTIGNLWLYDHKTKVLLTIAMETGKVTHRSYPPSDCHNLPVSNRAEVICRGPEQIYLFDLATSKINQLPIARPDEVFYLPPWIRNDRFIAYGYQNKNNEQQINIYSYDFITNQITLLADNVKNRMYFLSNDGKHLAYMDDNHIFDLVSNTRTDLTPTNYNNLIYNEISLSWSPISNLLYVGALDKTYNPSLQTNYHFIANLDTGIVQRISIPTDVIQDAYIGAYWSNDGLKIAIGGAPDLCIVDVSTLSSDCTESIVPNTEVVAIAWSPDSRYLAFVVSDTVYLYDIVKRQYTILFEDIDTSEIFWR